MSPEHIVTRTNADHVKTRTLTACPSCSIPVVPYDSSGECRECYERRTHHELREKVGARQQKAVRMTRK